MYEPDLRTVLTGEYTLLRQPICLQKNQLRLVCNDVLCDVPPQNQ